MAERKKVQTSDSGDLTEKLDSLSSDIAKLQKSINGLGEIYKEALERIDLIEDRLAVIENVTIIQPHIRSANGR